MRKISKIIIHCTATPARRRVTAAEVDRWHRARGWNGIGYHYLIGIDGTVERGRPEAIAGAHCKGQNASSIGIAYAGGLDDSGAPADTRTPAQRSALKILVTELLERYPGATIHGHNEFAAKACPCFNVSKEFKC